MAKHQVSRSVVIDAPAERIFDILRTPGRHHEFDGSGTVQRASGGDERLGPGSRFGMDMRMGLPYRIANRVVEYEEDRLLAWRHFGPHIWRWTLEPLEDGTTRVTETFDYRRGAPAYILLGYPARNARGIEQTLPRLKRLAEEGVPDKDTAEGAE
ncbi:SRPBCC family protein [Streptomonospora litoralis]|uniref:Polyketide cyclase / dehydrase and lipid transport n=1 Tax=Streptomonospora litoralis TaxID=2498135 RepID=A0A4P6PW17_9ACTN|nr:SRPBCC family protein [Streptomonospora litoralis]QBI52348.1 Polyketide cyclase / dehydrase and lipid transport [Streptomonospora litoralis]